MYVRGEKKEKKRNVIGKACSCAACSVTRAASCAGAFAWARTLVRQSPNGRSPSRQGETSMRPCSPCFAQRQRSRIDHALATERRLLPHPHLPSPPHHSPPSLSLSASLPRFFSFHARSSFFNFYYSSLSAGCQSYPRSFFFFPFRFCNYSYELVRFRFIRFLFFTFSYAPHISLGPSFFFRSYCSLGFVLRFYFCRCCRRRRCCTIRAKIFISAIFVSCFLALRSPS